MAHPLFKTVTRVTKISSISSELGVVGGYTTGKSPLQSLSRKKSEQSHIIDLSCNYLSTAQSYPTPSWSMQPHYGREQCLQWWEGRPGGLLEERNFFPFPERGEERNGSEAAAGSGGSGAMVHTGSYPLSLLRLVPAKQLRPIVEQVVYGGIRGFTNHPSSPKANPHPLHWICPFRVGGSWGRKIGLIQGHSTRLADDWL